MRFAEFFRPREQLGHIYDNGDERDLVLRRSGPTRREMQDTLRKAVANTQAMQERSQRPRGPADA